MTETKLFEKVFGCLAGQALGDAVGAPSEGLHYKAIQRRWGRVTEEHMGSRPEATRRGTTDDHALVRMVAKTIIRRGGRITADDFADGVFDFMHFRLMHWNELSIAARLSTGVAPREAGSRQINTPAPSFTCPPIGIVNACDPYGAAKDVYEVFSPWVDSIAQEAPMAVVAAIAEAFRLEATVESIVDASIRCSPPRVATYIEKAARVAEQFDDVYEAIPTLHREIDTREGFDLRRYASAKARSSARRYPAEDHDPGGQPIEMVSTAIAFFIIAKGDPMTALKGASNMGRDCDGTAGIAGAIAGAWRGIGAIDMGSLGRLDELNKVGYAACGEDYEEVRVLAEMMMEPLLNTIREKEETVRSLQGLL